MTATTLDCGCIRTTREGSRVAVLDACRTHEIRFHALSPLHEWGGHEDCCDMPYVRRAMERRGYTLADLIEAAETQQEPERTYVLRLLEQMKEADRA